MFAPRQAMATVLSTRDRILKTARHLFAAKGYGSTSTAQIAKEAGIAEGTIFRYFPTKRDLLIELAIAGWVEILTELLTELSQLSSYDNLEPMMFNRMLKLDTTLETLKVCFYEAQFHPELQMQIQQEVVEKMIHVAEDFFRTAIERGVYRKINPRVAARVFLGMFTIAGFSQETLSPLNILSRDEMARGLTDIFLHGVLASPAPA